MITNSWQRVAADVSAKPWPDNAPDKIAVQFSLPVLKRILDIAVAALSLVLSAPLMALLTVAVLLDSPGPVLYSSRRVGRNGRIFHCLKFRTMTRDGQCTRLGSFLRRYGLDELPQFINVLRGEMSIVGPRPVLACDCDSVHACRLRRFEMSPGMTGLWAVQKYPPFSRYVSPDDTYRRNWSLWLDVVIMFRSTCAALAGRGN